MDSLKNWALTVALTALAGGLVWLLSPKGNVQVALRTVITVFLLAAFLSPWLSEQGLTWVLPEPPASSTAELEAPLQEQMRQSLTQALQAEVQAALAAQGLPPVPSNKIAVGMDILPDNAISIAWVRVWLPAGTPTAALQATLDQRLGFAAQLLQEAP